jgi:glycosyltransferase involved in cell wall biosynthesis
VKAEGVADGLATDASKPGATRSSVSGDIDVVIPVHNGARHIRECLESVFAQTLRPRRVIVIDDGSTDDTVQVVSAIQSENPALLLHRMARNVGRSAARNAGLRLCEAPFVALIDADDVWLPNKLALQREVFEKSRRPVGFVHASFFLIDEAGTVLDEREPPTLLRGNVFFRLLRERNILSGSASAVLIKREILDKAGLFDEQLHYGEDWDLWLRLAAISEVDHTPEAVVGIRVRTDAAGPARRGVDRFLQVLKVYSHWEREVRGEAAILDELRADGFRAMLTNTRSFTEMMAFYGTLKTSDQSLARNLYRSRFDFWSGLVAAAVKGAHARLSRLAEQKKKGRRSRASEPQRLS